MRRSVVALRAALFVAFSVTIPLTAAAQTPTAEQLKMFQSLPQDQRDAILQQLGLGATAATGKAATPGTTGVAGGATDSSVVVRQPGIANAELKASQKRAEDIALQRDERIKGGEDILVELVLPPVAVAAPQRLPDVELALTDKRDRILKRNPYELSAGGVLQLPGLEPISLAGLNAQEAQERLALDPALREFTVAVTLLRIEPQGVRALKPYGYDIFRNAADALVPGTDIPVPDDYKVGPGDTMSVQLYGQQSRNYALPVGRDGTISFPELGPITVGGLGFGSARSLVEGRVKKQMIGTQARVSLSDLRSARVLVLGDAERPGSYVVSGLATATAALFASGGIRPIGSLRNIEVRRGGNLVRRLDLYDVLLKGNTEDDVRVQTGDAVFVPPVGATVGVDGAVHRPAIYELAKERTAGEVIALAGGLNPAADLSSVTLERIDGGRERRMFSLDLGSADGRAFALQNGDVIRVASIRPEVENGIVVEGHVYRPETFAYRAGIRLSNVLRSVSDLRPRADLNYILVRRESADRSTVQVFSADLSAALAHPGTSADIALSPRDRIDVFDLVSPRDQVVAPLLEEMSRQARPAEPTGVVEITGRINAPGKYPLETGMHVADLLRAGGGLQDAAYTITAELTRYEVVDGERRRSALLSVDIAAIMHGDATANVPLRAYDVLAIQEIPEWGRIENVFLRGEVRFPGGYRIRRGESLRSVIDRAGGLTTLSFAKGAVFTREELKEKERQQLSLLADRLQRDIATLALQSVQSNPAAGQSLAAGQALLDQLRSAKPVGRLVVNLERLVGDRSDSEDDVTLRNGDELVVPRQTQEVSVLGEVQNPTSHIYRRGLTRDELIAMSGGMTRRADHRGAYIVRADGNVVGASRGWLNSRNEPVGPGDTVIVPLDAERMRPLSMWTAITTIVYNLAVAAAAIGRF